MTSKNNLARAQQTASSSAPPLPDHSLNLTHSLLSTFYLHLCPLAHLLPAGLVKDGDSDAFRRLVEETMVASSVEEGIGALQVEERAAVGLGMGEILQQVHTRLFALHSKVVLKARQTPGAFVSVTPKNVLAFGYRPANEWKNDAVHNSGGAIPLTNFFANTIVAALRSSPEWGTLLARTGPHPLITLLASPTTALFTPLANACYLQVSGTSVSELKPHSLLEQAKSKLKRRSNGREGGRKRRRGKKRAHDGDEQPRATTPTHPSPPIINVTSPHPSTLLPLPPPKRARLLGPSISAPQLGSPFRHAPEQSLLAPTASARPPLRPAQSVASLLDGPTTRKAEAISGIAVRNGKRRKMETLWSPNDVVFERYRMFHSRPSKTSNGKLVYGFSPKHIFARIITLFPPVESEVGAPATQSQAQARHLAKYVFPRQFGLHNAFASPKPKHSYDIIPDYEDRELEIKRLGPVKTPKRIKGVLELLQRMILLQSRAKYRKLLDRHCPSKMPRISTLSQADRSAILELMSQPRTQLSRTEVSLDVSHSSLVVPHGGEEAAAKVKAKPRFSEYIATPFEVESFVKAVVREVVPGELWGSQANLDVILAYVSDFLRLRRFESMTVHTLLQRFCVADCDWLHPQSASRASNFLQKPNVVEMGKRRELLQEFIYWFIDGFVINLVRTAFNITDSAAHQNRALFFRQDDWYKICTPLLDTLGHTTFEKIPANEVGDILRDRELGFSYVRLLPKATGVRPIVNLARRPMVVGPSGRREVGKTINRALQNTFDVLTFERKRKPELVGTLVSSPQEIYSKLKSFKLRLRADGKEELPKLYFVKVDVQACYDTIKQDKLLEIVDAVLTENDYWIQRYAQVTPASSKAAKKFQRKACADDDFKPFTMLAGQLADDLHNAVLSDQVVYPSANREEVMRLLREHITTNLVKIGARFYRQKDGIPQGSVLSSLLCSLFYGDMEKNALGFTRDSTSILLRYVDDFLFISTKKPLASRFLRVMDQGHPQYGCYISTEKRLTNFDIALSPSELIPPLAHGKDFPWCGLAINTKTLDVKANTLLHLDTEISDKLTVQRHRKPGQSFINTMLRAIKIRSHVIYNDTTHNSPATVYLNIYQALLVVALKFQAYIHEWGADPRRRPAFFLHAIKEVIKYEYSVVQSRSRAKGARALGAECNVKRTWVVWLGSHAFHRVLSKKPAMYACVLDSLVNELRRPEARVIGFQLGKVVRAPDNAFAESANSRRR